VLFGPKKWRGTTRFFSGDSRRTCDPPTPHFQLPSGATVRIPVVLLVLLVTNHGARRTVCRCMLHIYVTASRYTSDPSLASKTKKISKKLRNGTNDHSEVKYFPNCHRLDFLRFIRDEVAVYKNCLLTYLLIQISNGKNMQFKVPVLTKNGVIATWLLV